MSCEVALATSIRVLILCLLTCAAYLVMFNIDMMCTRVSCDNCMAINWFIHVLILFMSFVVVVPVSHLRASPRKDSKFLLCLICGCDCSSKRDLFVITLLQILWLFCKDCICLQCL